MPLGPMWVRNTHCQRPMSKFRLGEIGLICRLSRPLCQRFVSLLALRVWMANSQTDRSCFRLTPASRVSGNPAHRRVQGFRGPTNGGVGRGSQGFQACLGRLVTSSGCDADRSDQRIVLEGLCLYNLDRGPTLLDTPISGRPCSDASTVSIVVSTAQIFSTAFDVPMSPCPPSNFLFVFTSRLFTAYVAKMFRERRVVFSFLISHFEDTAVVAVGRSIVLAHSQVLLFRHCGHGAAAVTIMPLRFSSTRMYPLWHSWSMTVSF